MRLTDDINLVKHTIMNSAITSPELTQGEPHPAVRLAELVCALIAAIAGPSWFWRFLPGGRAFWAQMHRMGQDFAALMHRLAAVPPAPPIAITPSMPAPKRRRHSQPTGELRPRHPRRAPRASTKAQTAPRPSAARPWLALTHIPANVAPAIITLRERRTRAPEIKSPMRAIIVSI